MTLELQIYGRISGAQWDALHHHQSKASDRASDQPLVFKSITNFPSPDPTTKIVVLANDLGDIDIAKIGAWLNSLSFGDSAQISWSPRAPNVVELSGARRATG